jgi:hypothetical protein
LNRNSISSGGPSNDVEDPVGLSWRRAKKRKFLLRSNQAFTAAMIMESLAGPEMLSALIVHKKGDYQWACGAANQLKIVWRFDYRYLNGAHEATSRIGRRPRERDRRRAPRRGSKQNRGFQRIRCT